MQIKEEYLEELAFLEMEEIKTMLEQFLTLNYNMPYELECRVKEVEKLKQKIALHVLRGQTDETLLDIKDIIGLRIIVDSEEEVEHVKNIMSGFGEYESLKDQFNHPRETGFKAYTYYYTCFGMNTEIQIMTKEMRDWTNETHASHDKRKYNELERNRTLPTV